MSRVIIEKLKNLQESLLDISNRNRMLNSNFQTRGKQHFRFIDEVPNQLYESLLSGNMEFIPLPAISKTPSDENTREFKEAYEKALLTDSDYLSKISEIENSKVDDINQSTENAQRSLKNKIRAELGLPEYKGIEISLDEHARANNITPGYELPSSSEELRHSDKKIQTLMVPETFFRFMRTIFNKYKSSIKEQGINPLYICFGFLEWRESQTEKNTRLAPLLMMPVNLDEKKSKHVISSTGEDILINQTLNEKLKKDFKIELPEIKFDDIEKKSFDIDKYLQKVNRIAEPLNWNVLNWGSFGIYDAQNMPIYRDLGEIIKSGPSKLLEKLLVGSNKPNDSSGTEVYDIDSKQFLDDLPSLITKADASQYSAVKDAIDGKNLVIKGPPGTGKSQTITNIIAALMQRKKKVLFIAQKQAALDVVRNNLQAEGLGDYLLDVFSVRANKKSVLESFKTRLKKQSDEYLDTTLRDKLKKRQIKLFEIKQKLNQHAQILKKSLGHSDTSIHKVIWDVPDVEIPEEFKNKIPEDAFNYEDDFLKENMNQLSFMVTEYKKIFKNVKISDLRITEIKKNFSPYEIEETENNLKKNYEALKLLFDKKNKFLKKRSSLNNLSTLDKDKFPEIYAKAKNKLKNDLSGKDNSIDEITLALAIDPKLSLVFKDLAKEHKKLTDLKVKLESEKKQLKSNFIITNKDISLKEIKTAIETLKKTNILSFLTSEHWKANAVFKNLFIGEKPKNLKKHELLEKLYKYKTNIDKRLLDFKKREDLILSMVEKINAGFSTDLALSGNFTLETFKQIDQAIFKEYQFITKSFSIELRALWLKDFKFIQDFQDLISEINSQSKLSLALSEDLTGKQMTIEDNYSFIEDIANSPISLKDYNQWILGTNEIDDSLHQFFNIAISHNYLNNDLPNIFKYLVRDLQKRKIYDFTNFKIFTSTKLETYLSEFKKLDKEVEELTKKAISMEINDMYDYAPEGNKRGRVSDKTGLYLIEHVAERPGTRTSIREIFERAGEAATWLKPCTLMSPLTVSQTLPLDELYDVVIIDEASQMKPEFALCGIARAKQAIIVGDPNQLPPTSFFQSSTHDDFDDDSNESILEMALTILYPPRELLYHYRSKHEDLIKFSNAEFYKNLMIPTNADTEDDNKGVKYVYVEDGIYRTGSEGVRGGFNENEADRVVKEAINLMKTRPKESLGIATMNTNQRSFIQKLFELQALEDPQVKEYLDYWNKKDEGLNEFFVKNLENVQGDERDIIIISTLFGPHQKGVDPYQRFGAINSTNGWRRLNVLFTRAKNQMIVFSSIKSNQIKVIENSKRGVLVFKKFLEFIETGRVDTSRLNDREIESPFQAWAIDQINSLEGFSADWEVGEHGYRIDIGVKHEAYPGYLMAVETDGATYHSSLSARDRDILRQEILEGYGWHFYRIWSTDWINDPVKTKENLHKALKQRLEECLLELQAD